MKIKVREADGTIHELNAKENTKSPDTSITLATSAPKQNDRKQIHTMWTWNNYTKDDIEKCRKYADSQARYMCWAEEEAPTTGTKHLQGYVVWTSDRSLRRFKKVLSDGKLHYGDENGQTNGSAEANRAYCLGMVEKKGFTKNPTFEEYGELPHQGKRSDWEAAINQLRTDDVAEVVFRQPQLLPCIRALERFKQLSAKPINRDVRTIVLVGKSGVGKSRYAYDNFPNLYSKPEGQWWDGYTGQDTILLDDYYGDIPYSQFLKVLDRYPLQVPIKGGFVSAQWTTIIITSNHSPGQWYKEGFTPALKRRMEITYMEGITQDGTPWKDVQEDPQQTQGRQASFCEAVA